jgi:hypothetical protein
MKKSWTESPPCSNYEITSKTASGSRVHYMKCADSDESLVAQFFASLIYDISV